MFTKLKVYKRFFQRLSKNHSKRKAQLEEYRRKEVEEFMNVQEGILSPEHYSHVEFDGWRFNEPLLEKYILEKRKIDNTKLRNIFAKEPIKANNNLKLRNSL